MDGTEEYDLTEADTRTQLEPPTTVMGKALQKRQGQKRQGQKKEEQGT